MGSLPNKRITPSRSFTMTGVDYAGPITLVNKGRGRKTVKSYIALFVCFTTKAVYLEAVNELTSIAFIAAFRRFADRRGRPRVIYSDNATNFVGADRELKEMHQFAQDQFKGDTGEMLACEGIE